MTRTRPGPSAIAGALALLAWAGPPPALADRPPPSAAIAPPSTSAAIEAPRPVARRPEGRRGSGDSAPASTGGWWLGTAGIALALAAVGWASRAARKFLPARDLGPIRVVGRASLSPRQSVFLVRVGDRVLILGAGPQGPPSALGEVTDPAELARLAPGRGPVPAPGRRIGGDE